MNPATFDVKLEILLKAGKIRIHSTKDTSIMSDPAYIEQTRDMDQNF
jgi:hypothetical protein